MILWVKGTILLYNNNSSMVPFTHKIIKKTTRLLKKREFILPPIASKYPQNEQNRVKKNSNTDCEHKWKLGGCKDFFSCQSFSYFLFFCSIAEKINDQIIDLENI